MGKRLRLSIKGTLMFFILFALILWMWSFFRSYLLFMAMLLMIAGVIISPVVLWIGRERLRVEAVLPFNRVGRNTDFVFDIHLVNPMWFAGFAVDVTYRWGNVFTGYSERKKEKLWAAPIKGGKIRHFINSRYAGRVEVAIEEFVVYDFLHIFYLTGCGKKGSEVLVWPAFSDGEETEEIYDCIEGFPKENESKKRGTDYNPDYEIREYIPGDELKSIHWKLSAKQGRMMVRERLATGRERINVLLPLGEDRSENDGLMESLYGLCRLLLGKEYPIQLYWPGKNNELCSCFMMEQGELENALGEILSTNGMHTPGLVEEQMSIEHPTESYILIKTGVYKGAYIR